MLPQTMCYSSCSSFRRS